MNSRTHRTAVGVLAHTPLLAACLFAMPAAAQVTFPDLIHRWTADNTADDAAGSADGVLNGAVGYTPGHFGQAFDIDSGEFITFGATTCNFGTADFTISYWVRFDAPSSSAMLTKRPICMISEMIDIRTNIGGGVGIEIAGDGTANYTSFLTPADVNDGAWHHVAWRRAGLTSTTFIDGCLGVVKVNNGIADFSNTSQFTLGRSPCGTTFLDGTTPFIGAMDEIQVYLRALTDAEIVSLADRGSGADLDGNGTVDGGDLGLLLGAWGPCPATGCCAADLNGDGTINGGDLGLMLGAWG